MGLVFDVYSAANPNGALLATLTDAKDKQVLLELRGFGAGSFSLPRLSAQNTSTIIAQGNLVKVRLTELSATPIGAFWMEQGRFDLVGQDDAPEMLTFGGRGALAYLNRAVMWNQAFVAGESGPSPEGEWPLYLSGGSVYLSQAGVILRHIIDEAIHVSRPQQPFPSLSTDFNYLNDSSGAAWATTSGTDAFVAHVGDYLDDVIASLLQATDSLIIQMGPTLLLQAFNSFGTVRTSATFASGKVRLAKGVNLATSLTREIGASRIKSHMLVTGDPGYSGYASSALTPVREGYASGTGTRVASLNALAASQITIRSRNADSARFGIPYGSTPLSGIYLPGPSALGGHYWLGDTITVHTGTGALDYNESAQRIASIAIAEDEDGTPVVEAALGSTYSGSQFAQVNEAIGEARTDLYNLGNAALRLARSMHEIQVVSSLPTLPDASYPVGSIVYLTTDGYLYKTETGLAGSWVTVVDAADLTGQITAGQIAANAIIAGKIAAAAVNSAAIATGAIQVGHLGQPPSQMITNGSFEVDGDTAAGAPITGWTIASSTGSPSNFETQAIASAVHTGLYSMRILGVNGTPQRMRSPVVPVQGGMRYLLSVWTRGAAANTPAAGVVYRVYWYDATGAQITSQSISSTVGTGTIMNQLSVVRTAPVNAASMLVELENASTSATGDAVFFDDVEVYRVDGDISHASGDVSIDSSGITIRNGKLAFDDAYGTTVLTGAGFSASWLRFILNRVYNSRFDGSTSAIPTSETGGGTPTANYNASISPNLPYWVVSQAGGTIRHVTDAAAPGGQALEMLSGAGVTNRIYQDVPVDGLIAPRARLLIRGTAGTWPSVYLSWRAADHSIIGARVGNVATAPTTTYRLILASNYALAKKPVNAAYLRVEIETFDAAATEDAFIGEVSVMEARTIYAEGSASSVSLAANTWVAPSLTEGENDDHLLFDTTTPSRLLTPYEGLYRVSATAGWTGDASTRRILGLGLDGATPLTIDERTYDNAGGATFALHQGNQWTFRRDNQGGYVQVYAQHNKATALVLTDLDVLIEYLG